MRLASTWKTGDASNTSPWWRSFVTRTLRTEEGLIASGTTGRRYRKMCRMVAQPAVDPRAAIREQVRRIAAAPGAEPEAIFRAGTAARHGGGGRCDVRVRGGPAAPLHHPARRAARPRGRGRDLQHLRESGRER